MAKINLTNIDEVYNGMEINFKAPCDCTAADGLLIGNTTYSFVNAVGDVLTGASGVWATGCIVSVILDCDTKKAYVQNSAAGGGNGGGAYPVGAIYMSVNSTSPASLFGGTWEQIKDKFLLSAGDLYAAGSTGGAASVTLGIKNLPEVSGDIIMHSDNGSPVWEVGGAFSNTAAIASLYGTSTRTEGKPSVAQIHFDNGGNKTPFSIMPPYQTVYVWKRTA